MFFLFTFFDLFTTPEQSGLSLDCNLDVVFDSEMSCGECYAKSAINLVRLLISLEMFFWTKQKKRANLSKIAFRSKTFAGSLRLIETKYE